MLEFGLQDDDKQVILDIFKAYPQVDEVILFGSRALNTFKATSDIDFAIKGKDVYTILAALINDFEESDLIYEVDVVDYVGITSEKLLEHIDRYGKVFYRKGWVELELGDVLKVQTGPFGSQLHNEDYVEVGTPMITVEHIIYDKIQHTSSTPKVSDEDKERLSKYILKEGDIVFSRVGSVDRSAYVSSEEDGWMFSGRLLRVRGNAKKVYPRYLHYTLTKESTKKYIRKIAVGATMPSINTRILSEIPIILPPLPEQKSIANILSSFDEKIALLREQNKTLETLAQTIFKEWFVNLKDGKSIPLSELIEFNPIEKIDRKREYLFFDMKTISTNSMVISEGVFKKSNSGTSFRVGDTLFAKITPCLENGKTAFVLDLIGDVVARGSTEFIVMRAKEKGSPYLNYCICRDNKFREYAVQSMTGTSGRQRVPVDRLKTYEIQYSQENISKFNDAAKSCFEKIKNNAAQIQSLSKTRDVLLPKLMAGKVRVSDES